MGHNKESPFNFNCTETMMFHHVMISRNNLALLSVVLTSP